MEPIENCIFFKQTWNAFVQQYGIGQECDVPIFETDSGGLSIQTKRSGNRWLLKQHKKMDELFRNKISELEDQINNSDCRGLIYIAYEKNSDGIVPVYIGIAEKVGKKRELSSPLRRKNGPYSRWGHDKNGHIGALSDAFFSKNIDHAYAAWIDRLFSQSAKDPTLKQPLYVWVESWFASNQIQIGTTKMTGCSLCLLEALLIHAADAVYSKDKQSPILNSTGIDRAKYCMPKNGC